MKVKNIGNAYKVSLIKGKIYDVIEDRLGWYQIEDELGDISGFPSDEFEIVEA